MLYVLYVITFLFIYVCHLGYHVLYMAVFILCTVLATGESSIYLNFISLFYNHLFLLSISACK